MICRFVVLSAVAFRLAAAADIRVVEEIAAKVNGEIVTKGEIDEQRQLVETYFRQEQHLNGPALLTAVDEQTKNVLRDKIDQLLLVQKAKELEMNVDSEVTRRLAEVQVLSKISDPEKFHDYIRDQTGMPFEEYKQKMTNEYLVHRVVGQEVGMHVTFPEADLRKYYDQHKSEFMRKEQVYLSQILISTEGKTPEQVAVAEKKAKDLVARARKGEKFSELVQANSDDPETARTGGQLPPYGRGVMPKEMEDAVFKEKKGYVTDPFRRPQGLVILRIEERYEAGLATFDEVKEQIQDKLAEPQIEANMRPFLTKLRQASFLEVKDGYTDTGAAPGQDTRWHEIAQLKPQTTTKEEVAAQHKKRKHLLFIPVPGTVDTRAKKADVDTSQLGERKDQPQAQTQPDGSTTIPIKQ
ncbi:MAG: peptidylprolyl isomerase [Bryobacteraceae bacterium]|jgi:parvulin-like peptidyl-prolyl isomerase